MFNTKVTIAGIDVTDYLTDGFVDDSLLYEIDEAWLRFNGTIEDSVTLASNQTVVIWRDYDNSFTNSDKIFVGSIETIHKKDMMYEISCFDLLNHTKKKQLSRVFISSEAEAGKISEIFKTLINSYTDLNANSSSVQDSGSLTLSQFRCRNAYIYERCKALASIINWIFYYNHATGLVNFEPKKFITNNNAITALNLASTPTWSEDQSELFNILVARGASIETENTQIFSGTGGNDTFTLAYKPQSVRVTVSSVLKLGGQRGSSGIDYYVDREQKKITFVTACAPGTNNVVINYSYASPLIIKLVNSVSVATYGRKERVITYPDITQIDDLINRANKVLQLYSDPFTIVRNIKVKNTTNFGYFAGQAVSITDPISKRTEILPIRRIRLNLRQPFDEIELGDKEFRLESYLNYETEYRIKKLEEESVTDTEMLYEIVQMRHFAHARRKTMRKVIQRVNDSFILGNDVCGVLGRGTILDDFEGTINLWTPVNCSVTEQLDT